MNALIKYRKIIVIIGLAIGAAGTGGLLSKISFIEPETAKIIALAIIIGSLLVFYAYSVKRPQLKQKQDFICLRMCRKAKNCKVVTL